MDGWTIMQTLIDNLATPVLIAFGAGIAIIVTKITEKWGRNYTIKSEIDEIEKRTKIRKDILESLEPIVESAVASNMQLADKIKQTKGKINQQDATMLKYNAFKLIVAALPKSLTEDDGVLLEIVGGEQQLESAIEIMIEKYVYLYKNKPNKIVKKK